jgi:SAM-dependent methyltransferase
LWGREDSSKFFSGDGSRGAAAAFYIEHMAGLLAKHAEELGRPLTIVDIGCGDFQVARNLLQKLPDFNYVGCDIVPEVIAHHAATYSSNRIRFQTLDAVRDRLPQGDVCLIRQVLQHLPNADILKITHRLSYPIVYVTEGQPLERTGPVNPDKPVGVDIRFDWRKGHGRGVELAEPPFNLDATEVFRVLSDPPEVIVTERIRLPKMLEYAAASIPVENR